MSTSFFWKAYLSITGKQSITAHGPIQVARFTQPQVSTRLDHHEYLYPGTRAA